MIKSVDILKTNLLNCSNKFLNTRKVFNFNIPKIKQLCKDIFVPSVKSEVIDVLPNTPITVVRVFDSKIDDTRLKYFATEFKAYNYKTSDIFFPNRYLCKDSSGEIRLKPHIYLSFVMVKPEYARQGAFTNVMKQLIEVAKNDSECEGRIILHATKMKTPGMVKIPSPSLAYWKCGFKFANEEDNKIMGKVLNGELPLEKAPEGIMYYAGV